jgi:predicted nucleic acid-binding protein
MPEFESLLNRGDILIHPYVIGELACGNLADRAEILNHFTQLPLIALVSNSEALNFIERRSLHGRGVGYIDIHLLASTVLDPDAQLWTLDRRLETVASDMGYAFSP